jgi:hypothetical protein
MAGHVARLGEVLNAYSILVGKHEGKRQLRRPRHRWEDNIRTYLSETGWENVGWIHLVLDRDQWQALVNKL